MVFVEGRRDACVLSGFDPALFDLPAGPAETPLALAFENRPAVKRGLLLGEGDYPFLERFPFGSCSVGADKKRLSPY